MIADADLWLVLEILDRQPADEAHLRIRQAIAYGRRTMTLAGDPGRWLILDDADAVLLRADLRATGSRLGPAERQVIARIVSQLR